MYNIAKCRRHGAKKIFEERESGYQCLVFCLKKRLSAKSTRERKYHSVALDSVKREENGRRGMQNKYEMRRRQSESCENEMKKMTSKQTGWRRQKSNEENNENTVTEAGKAFCYDELCEDMAANEVISLYEEMKIPAKKIDARRHS